MGKRHSLPFKLSCTDISFHYQGIFRSIIKNQDPGHMLATSKNNGFARLLILFGCLGDFPHRFNHEESDDSKCDDR